MSQPSLVFSFSSWLFSACCRGLAYPSLLGHSNLKFPTLYSRPFFVLSSFTGKNHSCSQIQWCTYTYLQPRQFFKLQIIYSKSSYILLRIFKRYSFIIFLTFFPNLIPDYCSLFLTIITHSSKSTSWTAMVVLELSPPLILHSIHH